MFYLAFSLILYLIINGLFMVLTPNEWYKLVPGVAETGGFNSHFIIDIGFIFILSGCSIAWRLLDAIRGRAAALFASGFLLLHACFHFLEAATSNHHASFSLMDFMGIYLPTIIALVVTLRKTIALPRWAQTVAVSIAHRGISNFENTFDYDADYMHEIAETDLDAIVRFSLLQEFGDYRGNIPVSAWYTAKLVSCIAEDCGPCTQLVVQMAEKEGVASNTLSAIVEGKRDDLDEVTKLFFDYAHAVVAHDFGAQAHREKMVERFGRSAVVATGLSMITGKAYPFMKYVMGHGQACTRVQVNGEQKTVNKEIFTPQGAL